MMSSRFFAVSERCANQIPRIAIFAFLMAVLGSSLAQSCIEEVEPNDAPTTAVDIGDVRCFVGEMAGQDQDAWVWNVTEDDASVPWTLSIEGIPGHLTILDVVRVTFTEDGSGVTAADTVLQFGTEDGSPRTSEPFLVSPGDRWFFGVAKSGGEGRYVVTLEPGDRISRNRDGIDPGDVDKAFGIAGVLDGETTFTWQVSADEATRRWGLELQSALGADIEATLVSPDGSDVGTVSAESGTGRLDSLGLTAGNYTVRIVGPGDRATTVVLDAVSQGIVTDGNEIEPNNEQATANVLPFGQPLEGGGGDRDFYVIAVDAEAASSAWDLELDADDNVEIRLLDAQGATLQEREGSSGTLPGLHLAEGRYYLRVEAGDNVRYTLELREARVAQDDFEAEPNDVLAIASEMPENLGVRGNLGPQDVDVFRFVTEAEPTLWRFQAIGDGAGEITVYNGGGVRQQRVRGEGRVRLDNLVLLPGVHYVAVTGGEGEYALRALPLGPAPEPEEEASPPPDEPLESAPAEPSAEGDAETSDAPVVQLPAGPPPPPGRLERENNDDPSRAGLLVPDAVHVGQLPANDTDVYRFFLANDALIQLEFAGPDGSETWLEVVRDLDGRVMGREAAGGAYTLWLLAGDYFVEVESQVVADGYYQLRMTHQDPLALPADLEPNDEIGTARPLPASGVVEGTVGGRDRYDFFLVDASDGDRDVTFSVEGEGSRLWLYDVQSRRGIEPMEMHDHEAGMEIRHVFPAGTVAALRIDGRGAYRLTGDWPDVLDRDTLRPVAAGVAALEPASPEIPVAAYWHVGQVVETSISLTHTGDERGRYRMVAHPSSLDASVELPEVVEVDPGQTVDVPVTIRLQDDLRDDQLLSVSIGAVDVATLETIGTARVQLPSSCEIDPVAPQHVWPVPRVLRGHLNVAWSGLGAVMQEDNREELHDGRAAPSRGEVFEVGAQIVVELAGDGPRTLVGTILDPLGYRGPARQLERFRIETSMDGNAWATAFEGALQTPRREQSFVFDEPVRARYARLVVLSSHERRSDVSIGEWKLIAEDDPNDRFDVATPSLGGQLVWSNVHPRDVEQTLVADGQSNVLGDRRPNDLVWVLGFHHGRAAQIAGLDMTPSPREGNRVEEVVVEASVTSPTGPYEQVATWRMADGALELPEPIWARYLKFTVPGPAEGPPEPIVLPDAIHVYERSVDEEYRSILGEWSGFGREAIYEVLTQREGSEPDSVLTDAGNTLEAATPLGPAGVVEGTVSVPDDADWYRIDLPEGDNLLDVTLTGTPSIDFRYRLYDADGAPVVADVSEDGTRVHLTAFVETRAVYLELWEPKRSVIFAWDTSGSVRPYEAITYASLAGFARDVDPEREFVQLLAYDDPAPKWLLPYWSADPSRVQEAIHAFDRRADSSNSFAAMTVATDALVDRDGTRAILLITDAETGGFELTPHLWDLLHEARPRVFSFEVSSASSDRTQDLMQSWAYVNDGHYSYARNVGDFDIGFRRASCKLRRAKGYRVEVATRYEAPPGPGTITVVPGPDAAKPAIEVILDASGSMGAKLPDGTSRIDAALETLQGLVSEGIEEGTPFALRAFGHVTPSTCEQELVVPLGPLDRTEAMQAIAAIEPKLLSQTPIADALRSAADDLASAGGPVAIVLITDGEESCGGDPEAALAELRAAGIDVTLSIVSLALDDAAASERFARLAEIGNGAYTDVGDPAGLATAIRASLAVPFEVLGPDGSVLARGSVGGEPVSLERGVYTIRVPGSPPTLIRDVRVPGDSNTTVSVGD